jgi:hypothetical protein
MPTDQILALLIAERDKLNAAISLLGGTPAKRRGRPPKSAMLDWVTSNKLPVTAPAPEKPARKKRKFSPAQRKAAAERMRQMWAKKKKAAKKA